MRIYAVIVYLFLYTPIAIIALFSFNAGRHASQLQGFSTQWYARALKNPFVMDALETSLIGAFVSANPARFHEKDGSGYRLLADVVIELNGINPQIASRLVRLMSRWRRYDSARQDLMRAQLERIRESKGLSKDVLEIVSKSL